jgi:hypothetical protein
MRPARVAEPRPQLEAVLQCLLVVVLVGRVFNDNGVISLVDFAPLLGLGFLFIWDLDQLRRQRQLGDELLQVILQEAQFISATALMQQVLDNGCGY